MLMSSRVDEGDTVERQLRLACAELERRLYAGEDCRAETIIERIPALASDPNCTIELIYAEYVIREELGQNPSPEEFFVRFPQWRERLERQFQVHELLSGEEDLEPNRLLDLPMIPKPGDGAENYEVLEKIGQGAMGEVFKVLDRQLNRVVALKKIRPSASPSEMVRFRQEAEKMAQLEHPNIVRVYAVGELNGLPFFSMELAPGGNLSQLIGDKSQSPDLTAQYGETLARAMHYAHLQNIIHRDLKPSNVVLTAAGEPKITDFGLAKTMKEWADESAAEGEASRQGEGEKSGGAVQNTVVTETMRDTDSQISLASSPSVPRNPSLTQTGTVLGTPAYMSPEQAAGNSREIGPRTDVYALGTILYEMLTGRRPFQGRSPREILKQVQEEEPKPPRIFNRKLDAELEAVCLKCLEKKPHRRYPTADALAEDLRRWQRGERTQARPRSRLARVGRRLRQAWRHPWAIAASLLIVALTGFLGYQLLSGANPADPTPPPNDPVVYRSVKLVTNPPGARIAMVPVTDYGEFLPDGCIRSGKGEFTPLTLHGVPAGRYLVVAEVAGHGFHEVYRIVPPCHEMGKTTFDFDNSKENENGLIEIPSIKIPSSVEFAKTMAYFAGAEFIMGDHRFGRGGINTRAPHARTIASFYLDTTEVMMGDLRKYFPHSEIIQRNQIKNDNFPITMVSFQEAMAFAERVGKRLPTEAEYEFAATGGGKKRYPWGDEERNAWGDDGILRPVKDPDWDCTATEPKVYGLYSNVGEWTDSFHIQYDPAYHPTVKNYSKEYLAQLLAIRVARGAPDFIIQGIGPQQDSAFELQLGPRWREGIIRELKLPGLGFRCARSAKPRFLDGD
jgi:serine/threonine protein kinase/formylglycine-generating enzyme required for sulfatase activity